MRNSDVNSLIKKLDEIEQIMLKNQENKVPGPGNMGYSDFDILERIERKFEIHNLGLRQRIVFFLASEVNPELSTNTRFSIYPNFVSPMFRLYFTKQRSIVVTLNLKAINFRPLNERLIIGRGCDPTRHRGIKIANLDYASVTYREKNLKIYPDTFIGVELPADAAMIVEFKIQ